MFLNSCLIRVIVGWTMFCCLSAAANVELAIKNKVTNFDQNSSTSSNQFGPDNGQGTTPPDEVKNYAYNFREENNITAEMQSYTTALFGDNIDYFSGAVAFQQTDINIPGNFDIPVSITRKLADPDSWFSETRDFGNWSLDIPHARSTFITDRAGNNKGAYWSIGKACTSRLNSNPSFNAYVEGHGYESNKDGYWNGDTIYIPNQGSVKLTEKSGDTSYKRYNNKNWKVDCLISTGQPEGFKVTLTNGVKYFLTQKKIVKSIKPFNLSPKGTATCTNNCSPETFGPSDSPVGAQFPQYYAFMLATRVEDRFGNWVKYHYDPQGQLIKLTSSDNRTIDLNYSNGNVISVTANGKTWLYTYDDYRIKTLKTVNRPDNKKWQFSHDKTSINSLWVLHNVAEHSQVPYHGLGCVPGGKRDFITMLHPDGMEGEFVLDEVCHGQSNVPKFPRPNPQRRGYTTYWIPLESSIFSISKKTLKFTDGKTYTWRYEYSKNKGHFKNDPIQSEHKIPLSVEDVETAHLKSTIIVNPDSSKIVQYFDRQYGPTIGNIKFSETYGNNGSLLVRRRFEYKNGQFHGLPRMYIDIQSSSVPWTEYDVRKGHQASQNQILSKSIEYNYAEGGADIYTTEHLDYDIYDKFRLTIEKNNFSSEKKYTKNYYFNDLDNWLISLPQSRLISSDGLNYQEVHKTTYHSAGGSYKSLPHYLYEFGRKYKNYDSYHTSTGQIGLPQQVRYNDVNQWVEFSNYKRGKPQTIRTPQSQSLSSQYGYITVNNDGLTTKITDFLGDCTNYSYNAMGRLTLIDPCDPRWSNTLIEYTITTSSEGLPTVGTGFIKQKFTKGFYQQDLYYDNLLRPVMSKELDVRDEKTARYSHTQYDALNQITRQSFPSNHATTLIGTETEYDALGRVVTQTRTSDGSTSRREYLTGNKVAVTDGENNTTTTTYLAYGEPSFDKATLIEATDSDDIAVEYNLFDQVTSIRQGNVTETRLYDAYQQLCKQVRPETGITAFGYNAQRQQIWRAQGTNGSTTSCDAAAVPASHKVLLSYDNLGQLQAENFPDTTPDNSYGYDANGNLTSLISGHVSWSYLYNSLNGLEKETLSLDGESFVLDWEYSGLGAVRSLKYPSGVLIDFAPNALGQPTKAGNFATNASYYANGQIKQFTYGNGIVRNVALDSTGRIDLMTDSKGGVLKNSLDPSYDYNDNLAGLIDGVDAANNISNLSYDGLDRLASADGRWGKGSYHYDGLGNITSRSISGSAINYSYDNLNRLSKLSGAYGYGYQYDSRGNVTHNGRYGLDYNLGQQMTMAKGISYVYDGHNRRVKQTKPEGSHYSVYSSAGQLLHRQTADGTKTDSIYLGKQLIAEVDNGTLPSSPALKPVINVTITTAIFKGDPCRTFSDCEVFPMNTMVLPDLSPKPLPKPSPFPTPGPVPTPSPEQYVHLVQWNTAYAAHCTGAINKSIAGTPLTPLSLIGIASDPEGLRLQKNGILYNFILTCTGPGGTTTKSNVFGGKSNEFQGLPNEM